MICDGMPNAECSATLTALEGKLELAHVPVTRFHQANKVILEMELSSTALALLETSNRLPALLETRVVDANGPVCRNVFSSMLIGVGAR